MSRTAITRTPLPVVNDAQLEVLRHLYEEITMNKDWRGKYSIYISPADATITVSRACAEQLISKLLVRRAMQDDSYTYFRITTLGNRVVDAATVR